MPTFGNSKNQHWHAGKEKPIFPFPEEGSHDSSFDTVAEPAEPELLPQEINFGLTAQLFVEFLTWLRNNGENLKFLRRKMNPAPKGKATIIFSKGAYEGTKELRERTIIVEDDILLHRIILTLPIFKASRSGREYLSSSLRVVVLPDEISVCVYMHCRETGNFKSIKSMKVMALTQETYEDWLNNLKDMASQIFNVETDLLKSLEEIAKEQEAERDAAEQRNSRQLDELLRNFATANL